MQGTNRKFNQKKYDKKYKNLIYCIISNIDFPNIKVRFVAGEELLKKYNNFIIPRKDHDKFFKGLY